MNETVLIEESLKQEVETVDGDHFQLLVLVKEVEKPDLIKMFLQGLCKPYDKTAFFIYGDAIELLEREDCEELLACFIRKAGEGLRVFVANESLPSACPIWLSCCSMRDLPILIQEATKVVSI